MLECIAIGILVERIISPLLRAYEEGTLLVFWATHTGLVDVVGVEMVRRSFRPFAFCREKSVVV